MKAHEDERSRRRSGGIAIDDTPDRLVALSENGETSSASIGSLLPGSSASLVPEGTLISAILETAIQSDLPGSLRAVVSDPVWSGDGNQILIPKGSRLTARYEAEIATGQSRVLIAWSRAILPDGRSVALDARGLDRLGRAGLSGDIDRHFATTFEAAFLISAVSAISGISGSRILPNEIAGAAVSDGSTEVSDALSESLGEHLSIPPTIHVDQGTPITVFVQRDLRI